MDELELIEAIENDCWNESQPVIERVVGSAKRRINAELRGQSCFPDEFPSYLKPFDMISVMYAKGTIDSFNPFLCDYIDNVLEDEYERLSSAEKTILRYCDCHSIMEHSYSSPMKFINASFWSCVDEHSGCARVKRYLDRV